MKSEPVGGGAERETMQERQTKRAAFRREVAECRRIRELPGVVGWEPHQSSNLLRSGPDVDGKRIDRKPTLEELDGDANE